MLSLDKKELILRNISMVKHFVSKFYVDDFGLNYDLLLSQGMAGLLNCVDEYNSKNGIKFQTFASNKIKLEILNEIRRTSSFTMDDVLVVKKYCSNMLTNFYTGTSNNNINLNSNNDISIKNKCLLAFTAFLDEFLIDSTNVQLGDLINDLAKDIDTLSKLEKSVLYLFYKEELNYNQISIVLDISTNHIFYIHAIGLSKIREFIKQKQ